VFLVCCVSVDEEAVVDSYLEGSEVCFVCFLCVAFGV